MGQYMDKPVQTTPVLSHSQCRQGPAGAPIEKVYSLLLCYEKNHETEREVVCLKQYTQLVPESEQKASVPPLPQCYDGGDDSNGETQRG